MRWAPFTQRCSYFLAPLACTVNARNSAPLQTSVRLVLWNTHHTLLMPLMTKVWQVHSLREWSTKKKFTPVRKSLFAMLKTHAQTRAQIWRRLFQYSSSPQPCPSKRMGTSLYEIRSVLQVYELLMVRICILLWYLSRKVVLVTK